MLTLIEKTSRKAKDGCYIYICKCDCSKLVEVSSNRFNNGTTRSCGCLRGKAGTHHYTKHPMFARYKVMIARCNNPKNKSYKNYGGRGIKVCDRWAEPMPSGMENFMHDMGECPSGYSLERVNNNGDYSPDNCIWADTKTQSRNKTTSHFITIEGSTKTLAEWVSYFKCSDYKILTAYGKFGDDIKSIQKYCDSKLYMSNSTGYKNITFDKSRGVYITRYLCYNGNMRSKRFKTLEEAVQFKKDNCYEYGIPTGSN